MAMMDPINLKILAELKRNSRIGWGALAATVGISRQSLKKRVERLERKGHILGYTTVTPHQDSAGDEGSVSAFLRIRFAAGNDCFKLSRLFPSYAGVEASWAVTGDWDCVILARTATMEDLSELRELIVGAGGIDEIETEVVLNNLYPKPSP